MTLFIYPPFSVFLRHTLFGLDLHKSWITWFVVAYDWNHMKKLAWVPFSGRMASALSILCPSKFHYPALWPKLGLGVFWWRIEIDSPYNSLNVFQHLLEMLISIHGFPQILIQDNPCGGCISDILEFISTLYCWHLQEESRGAWTFFLEFNQRFLEILV